MKNIISFLIAMVLTTSAFAQAKPQKVYKASDKIGAEDNVYIQDDELNKFVGTWEGKEGKEALKLNLTKIKRNVGSKDKPLELDLITGSYEYSSQGKIVSAMNTKSITGSSSGKQNTLFLTIYDPASKTNTEFQLTVIDNNTIKLEPSKRKVEGRTNNSLSIPKNMVLSRG